MWLMTIWRLLLEMWADVPQCNCNSNQGRWACKCKEARYE